jgi:PAS domain S-box-containing protein
VNKNSFKYKLLDLINSISDEKELEHQVSNLVNIDINYSYEKFRDIFEKIMSFKNINDIYNYIGDILTEIVPDCIIFINVYDKEKDQMQLLKWHYPNEKFIRKALDIIGFNPAGKTYPVDKRITEYFETGKLEHFEGGLIQLSEGYVPKMLMQQVVNLLNLDEVHLIGLKRSNEFFAGIQFYTFNDSKPLDTKLIETFVYQVSIALQKKYYETELIETNQMLAAITKSANDAIIMINSKAEVVFWNDAAELIFGYSEEEMYGKKVHDVIAPEHFREDFGNNFKHFVKTGEGNVINETIEVTGLHKDGHIIYVELSLSAIKIKDSWHAIAIIRDVSSRKLIEETLRESEERFKMLSDVTFEGILIHENGVAIDMNRAFAEMFGYEVDELLYKNILSILVYPDDMPIIKENIIKEVAEPYEVRAIKKDKSVFPMEIEAKNIRFSGKNSRVAAVRDISLKKQQESLIKESEKKYRLFIENSTDSVALTDEKGKIIEWNKAIEELTGYSIEEVKDMMIWEVQYMIAPTEMMTEKVKQQIKDQFNQFFEKGNLKFDDQVVEIPIVCKNGKRKIIQQSGFSIKTEKGYRLGSISRDVTKYKEYEQKITEKNNELQELNAAKNRFFSIIAHDLKSPFNSFLGLTDYVMKDFRKLSLSELNEIIHALNSSAENLYKMLENLLSWSMAQTNSLIFNPVELNIDDLISEMLLIFNQIAKDKNIKIEHQMINKDLNVIVDKEMLLISLRNLLNNAIKYSHRNSNIYVKTLEIDNNIQIQVIDYGIGIEEKIQQNLFSFESKQSVRGTEEEHGTGLGLIVTKEFIEKNKGQISFESTPEKGSTFKITLPKANN